MPLTKQQQEVIDQLEFEERYEAAFNLFIKENGDAVGPYFDGATAYENAKKMTTWALVNLGREKLTSVSAWEIAFNDTKASLAPDPRWRPAKVVFDDLEVRLSAAQWKQIYQGEMPTLRADLAADLAKIGGPEAFKKYVDGEAV